MSDELLNDICIATLEFIWSEFPSNWLSFVFVCVHWGRCFFFVLMGEFGFIMSYACDDLRLEVVIGFLFPPFAMYLSTYFLNLIWCLVWPFRSFMLCIFDVCGISMELRSFVLCCCLLMLEDELLVDNMKLLSLL